MRHLFTLFAGAIAMSGVVVATPSQAQVDSERLVATLLSGKPAAAEHFSPYFLAHVPLERLNETLRGISAAVGPLREIRPESDGQHFRLRSASHQLRARLLRDADGRITSLWFGPSMALAPDLSQLAAPLLAGGGETSLLVMKADQSLISHHGGKALAVGSSFKLGVLAVLAADVKAGRRQWHDVVTLADSDKSLPSGMLQDFPAGSPLTLHTLAALMVSKSDNTATDMLMRLLGRKPVSDKLQQFALSTRELFLLKASPAVAQAYLAATTDEARETTLASGPDDMGRLMGAAMAPHIAGAEWYLSAQTLCGLLGEVGHLDLFAINPGPATPADWRAITYKGGSEAGVLNLSSRLIAPNGDNYCVVFTRNAAENFDDKADIEAYTALLAGLAILAEKP